MFTHTILLLVLVLPIGAEQQAPQLTENFSATPFSDGAQQNSIQQPPDTAEVHARLGTRLLNEGHYDSASKEFAAAVHIAPASSDYAMRLAESLILGQHYQAALQFLNQVRKQFESLREYQFKMGLVVYGLRQYPQAISIFQELDREHPDLALIQYYLANCYNDISELDKAESYARKAVAINPDQSSNYVILAQVLKKEGGKKTEQAVANLNEALILDPSNALAKQELALCYEARGNYANAERLLKEVVLQAPDVLSAHVILSRIYHQEHKMEEENVERKAIERIESQIPSE